MDIETILLGALGVLVTVAQIAIGWLVAILRDSIRDLFRRHNELSQRSDEIDAEIKQQIANVRVEQARDYVPRNELQAVMEQINSALRRIEDKLDGKVDK